MVLEDTISSSEDEIEPVTNFVANFENDWDIFLNDEGVQVSVVDSLNVDDGVSVTCETEESHVSSEKQIGSKEAKSTDKVESTFKR